MASLVPLIEQTRGDTLENTYFGAVAVVDTEGRPVAHAGDPHWVTFTRSSLKPLQALPFVESGGPQALKFTDRNLALVCASHSGEPMHVAEVDDMLGKAGLTYKRLQCGCHVPYYVAEGIGPAPASYDERHHNCSGKHSGFLSHCVHRGWSVEDYLSPDHPGQREVRRDVARAVGMAPDDMKLGIDGCSAPNYAIPLSALARGFARLASGSADREFGASFATLSDAMTAHPELVSGTKRADEAFMRVGRGDWVAKAGAEGVQAVGSRSRGLGFALKVSDGNSVARHAAVVEVMDELGWLDDGQRETLRPWRSEQVTNWRKTVVGARRPAFTLERG